MYVCTEHTAVGIGVAARGRGLWFTGLGGREFRVFSCARRVHPPARASQRWGRGRALEPTGQMPNTMKEVVDDVSHARASRWWCDWSAGVRVVGGSARALEGGVLELGAARGIHVEGDGLLENAAVQQT